MKRLIVINIVLMLLIYFIPQKEVQIEKPNAQVLVKSECIASKTKNIKIEEKEHKIEKISQKGIDLIKKYEGCKLQAYKLKNERYYTIGYGHYGADVKQGQQITQDQAETLLKNDLQRFEGYVKNNCKHLDLNQNEFDSLVSFTFNCGQGNLQKLIKNRTKEEIAERILNYTKSSNENNRIGLKRRRADERNLFLGGN